MSGKEIDYNKIVDRVLKSVNQGIAKSNMRKIPIPDMNEKFEMMRMEGGVQAKDGYLEDLATLQRVEDVEVHMHEDKARFGIRVSIQTLLLTYSSCKSWLGPVKVQDALKVIVGKDIISFQISVNIKKGCKTKVDHVKIEELTDMQVEYKGGSKFLNPIMDSVMHHMKNNIETILGSMLTEALDQSVNTVSGDFCDKIKEFQQYAKK